MFIPNVFVNADQPPSGVGIISTIRKVSGSAISSGISIDPEDKSMASLT
jgi:hypothetical protein